MVCGAWSHVSCFVLRVPDFVFPNSCFDSVSGLPGFMFRVPRFEFRMSGPWSRIPGFSLRVAVFVFKFSVFGFRFPVFGFRVSNIGIRVLGFRLRDPDLHVHLDNLGLEGRGQAEEVLQREHKVTVHLITTNSRQYLMPCMYMSM